MYNCLKKGCRGSTDVMPVHMHNGAAGRRSGRKAMLVAVKKRWKSVQDKFPLVDGIFSVCSIVEKPLERVVSDG